MKAELPCAVVRDLLPSYVEGLTEPETQSLVEEHLRRCTACADRCRVLRAPEPAPAAGQERQVDYLRQVRRKNLRRILLAVLAACCTLVGCACILLFLTGWKPRPMQIHAEPLYSDGGDTLQVHLFLEDSALAITGERLHIEGDTAELSVRLVLTNPLHRSSASITEVPLEGIREVRLQGRTIWQDGLFIHDEAHLLREARTPYVGSMWQVAQVAGRLPLPDISYENSLQTSARPYGWTLHFAEPLPPAWQERMRQLMPVALALVDNMDVVSWEWPDAAAGELRHDSLSAAQVSAALPELAEAYNRLHGTQWAAEKSVKDYAESAFTVQQLLELLQIS